MLKKLNLFFIILILGLQSCGSWKNNGFYTIYLVRHSEKEVSASMYGTDPPLTPCGKKRSESLSNFLKDVPIEVIYSTDYTRTKNTALPTAQLKGLNIQQYDGESLEDFSKVLLRRKQDALVVGHSNTTGVLAGLLTGQKIGEFDLDIYDRIYQVSLRKRRGRLHIFHTAFECQSE